MWGSVQGDSNLAISGKGDNHDPRGLAVVNRVIHFVSRPFFFFVLLPTLIAAAYFLILAAPQYVSEAQFVVRGEGTAPPGALSTLLGATGGGGSASEDTFAVQDYMMSRDAMEFLIREHNLKKVYARKEADYFARFPGPLGGVTSEHFFKYYQRHVLAELDSTTGISTLSVRTFSAEDSQVLARALMDAAEQLVNRMNARQRENLISSSRKEQSDTQQALRNVNAKIAEYRTKEALIDPLKQSVPLLSHANELTVMLTSSLVQIGQLSESAPRSPLLPVLRERVRILRQHIDEINGKVAGPGSTLVPKITEYDDLITQRTLLEKQLEGAAMALEAAKTRADRQRLYIDEVVRPNLPDYAAYPKVIASIFVVFMTVGMFYAIGRLVISGAREHQVM